MDMFGSSVNFNVAGKQKITTTPGVIMTIAMMILMIAYFSNQFQVFFYKRRPMITQTAISQFYDSKFNVNLKEIDFKVAWAVESYVNGSALDDPNYV